MSLLVCLLFHPFHLDMSALLSALNIILLDLGSDLNTATTQFFPTSQLLVPLAHLSPALQQFISIPNQKSSLALLT